MRLFIIALLGVAIVKALSLGDMRDALLGLSFSYLETQTAPTHTQSIVTYNIENISAQKAKLYHSNKVRTRHPAKKIRRRRIRDLQLTKLSNNFNLTLAIEKGIEFQAELCSVKCDEQSSHINMARKCTQPLCPVCRCDSNCSQYGDCCNFTQIDRPSNDNDAADDKANLRYSCFLTNASTAVYIIASCHRRISEYLDDMKPHNFSIHLNEVSTDDIRVDMSETEGLQSECNSCLSVPESIHLITSSITGLTYCNQNCLICNEDRSVDDFDFRWGEEKSCSATEKWNGTSNVKHQTSNVKHQTSKAGGGNDSMAEKIAQELQTECQVTFRKPENVSTRECDKQTHSHVVDTCSSDFSESQSNLTSESIVQIGKLCQAFHSPVYEGDVAYQNVFCYLCQGKVPACPIQERHHGFNVDVNIYTLGLLTDVTGGDYYYDNEQIPTGSKDSTGLVADEPKDEKADLTCQDGYWKDEAKGECLLIGCVSDRHMPGNTSTSAAYCQMEDSQPRPDLYKLNLIWYIQFEDDFLSADLHLHHNHMNTISEVNSNSLDSHQDNNTNCQRTQKENIDRLLKDIHFPTSEHPQINASCDELMNKLKLHEHDKSRRKGTHFVKPDRLARSVPRKTPSVSTHIEPSTIDDEFVPTSESVNGYSDKTVRLSRKRLVHVMKQYIGSALKDMGLVDFFFQMYRLKENNTNFRTGRGDDRMFDLEDEVKSFTADREPSSGVGAVMADRQPSSGLGAVIYLVFNSGDNREVFESNILHHFSGIKAFTTSSDVVTVEQVLSNADSVFVNMLQPVYLSDRVDGDCCSFVTPEELPELVGQKLCWDQAHRAIPFSVVTSCPHVTFNISDFNVSKNWELSRSDVNISLRRSQYLRQDQTISVCVHSLDPPFHKHPVGLIKLSLLAHIENVLTLVTLSVSLACLLVTLTTYVLFPSLRSLPGKNNMILVCWLFVAQLLVILNPLPPRHSTACTVLGVVLHYAWLSTLSWTCVCSYHMCHVFVVQRGAQNLHKSHKKYLIRYLLVTNLTSLIVVTAVISSSLYLSGGKSCGYGGRNCYLSSSILVGVSFLLPLSLILLLNCIFFALTVCTISHIDDVKRQSGRDRRNVQIYFRLSSLTGLCWLLALLAEIPGLKPLRCFSVLVNGCQGITLFLSYVCNRRVMRMWCHLVRSKRSWLKIHSRDSNQQITMSSSL